MVSESLKLTFNLLTIEVVKSSLALGAVTSFFLNWRASKLSGFWAFLENDNESAPNVLRV